MCKKKDKLDDDESTPAQKKPSEQFKPIKRVKSDNKTFSSPSDTFKNVVSIDETSSSKTNNGVLSVEMQNPLTIPQDLTIDTVLTDSNTKTSENSKSVNTLKITTIPDTEKTNSLKPSTSSTSDTNGQPATPSGSDTKLNLAVNADDIKDFSPPNTLDSFDLSQFNDETMLSRFVKESSSEDINNMAKECILDLDLFGGYADTIKDENMSMDTFDTNDGRLSEQDTSNYKNMTENYRDVNFQPEQQQNQQQTSSQSQDVHSQMIFDTAISTLDASNISQTQSEQLSDELVQGLADFFENSCRQNQTQLPHGDSSSKIIKMPTIPTNNPQKRKSNSDTATKSTDSESLKKKKSKTSPTTDNQQKAKEGTLAQLQKKLQEKQSSTNANVGLESERMDITSSSVASTENVIPQTLVDLSASSTNVSSSNLNQDNIVPNIQVKPSVTTTVEATKTPISSPEIDVVATTSKKEKIMVLPTSTSSNIADDANVVVSDRADIMMTTSLPATTSTGVTTTTTTVVSSSSAGVTTATVADTTKTNTPITITSVSENVTSSTSTATATPGNLTNFLPTTTTSVSQNENVTLTTSTATATSGNITDVVPTTTTSVSQNVTSTADTATTIPTTITKNTPTTTAGTVTSANITKTTPTTTAGTVTSANISSVATPTLAIKDVIVTAKSSIDTSTTSTANDVGDTKSIPTSAKDVKAKTGGSISTTTTPTTVLNSVLTTSASSTIIASSTTTTTTAVATAATPTVISNDATKTSINSENIIVSNAAKDITPTSSSPTTPQSKKSVPTSRSSPTTPQSKKSVPTSRSSPTTPQSKKSTTTNSDPATGSGLNVTTQNMTKSTTISPLKTPSSSIEWTNQQFDDNQKKYMSLDFTLDEDDNFDSDTSCSSGEHSNPIRLPADSESEEESDDDSGSRGGRDSERDNANSDDSRSSSRTTIQNRNDSDDDDNNTGTDSGNNDSGDDNNNNGDEDGKKRDNDGEDDADDENEEEEEAEEEEEENELQRQEDEERVSVGDEEEELPDIDENAQNKKKENADRGGNLIITFENKKDDKEEEILSDTDTHYSLERYNIGDDSSPVREKTSPTRSISSDVDYTIKSPSRIGTQANQFSVPSSDNDDEYFDDSIFDQEYYSNNLQGNERSLNVKNALDDSYNEEGIEHEETVDTGLNFKDMKKSRENQKKQRQLKKYRQGAFNKRSSDYKRTQFPPIPSSSSSSASAPSSSTSKSSYENEYLDQLRKGIASADDNCNLVTTLDASDSDSEDCADVPDSYKGIPLNLLDSSHKPFANILDKINLNTLAMETTPLIQGVMCATKAKEDTDLQFQEKSVEIMERLGKLERDNKLIFLDKDMEYRKFEGEEKQKRRDYKFKIKQMKAQSDLQIKLQQLKLVNGTSIGAQDSFENGLLSSEVQGVVSDKNEPLKKRIQLSTLLSKNKSEALLQKRHDVDILKVMLAEARAQQEYCNEQRRLENTKAKKLHFVHPSSATSAHFITSNESCEVADRIRFLELWDYKTHSAPIEIDFTKKDAKTKSQELKELAKKVVVNDIEFSSYIYNLVNTRNEHINETVMNLRIKLCAEMDREEMYLFHTGRKFKHSVYRVNNTVYKSLKGNVNHTLMSTRYAIIYHDGTHFVIDLWEYIYKRNSFPICTIYPSIPNEMSSKYMTKRHETGPLSDKVVMNKDTKGKYKALLVTTDDTNLLTPASPLNFSFVVDDSLALRNTDIESDKSTVIIDNQQPSCSRTTILDDGFDENTLKTISDFQVISSRLRNKIINMIKNNAKQKFNAKLWKNNALKMISYTNKSMQEIFKRYDDHTKLVDFNKALRSQLRDDEFLSEDVIDGFFGYFFSTENPISDQYKILLKSVFVKDYNSRSGK